jgi:hypothetical protein
LQASGFGQATTHHARADAQWSGYFGGHHLHGIDRPVLGLHELTQVIDERSPIATKPLRGRACLSRDAVVMRERANESGSYRVDCSGQQPIELRVDPAQFVGQPFARTLDCATSLSRVKSPRQTLRMTLCRSVASRVDIAETDSSDEDLERAVLAEVPLDDSSTRRLDNTNAVRRRCVVTLRSADSPNASRRSG